MAKTSTQRMRELRARKQELKKKAEKAFATTTYEKPLSTFFVETGRTGFGEHYLKLGEDWWDFTNDVGIKPFDGDELNDDEKESASNSLGKAEFILNVLQDLVMTLASDINEYKRSEISDRISEIEKSDFSDPNIRKEALANMIRLQKMLDHLSKQSRWTLPQYEVSID